MIHIEVQRLAILAARQYRNQVRAYNDTRFTTAKQSTIACTTGLFQAFAMTRKRWWVEACQRDRALLASHLCRAELPKAHQLALVYEYRSCIPKSISVALPESMPTSGRR